MSVTKHLKSNLRKENGIFLCIVYGMYHDGEEFVVGPSFVRGTTTT